MQCSGKVDVFGGLEPLTADARQVVKHLFPQISENTWKTMDASKEVPAPAYLSPRRPVWLITDLKLWASLGFPNRRRFEIEKKALDEQRRKRR